MAQIHKKFRDSEVKELIERYLKKEIEGKYIQEILGIGKTRFFALAKDYCKNPASFSIQYTRKTPTRISQSIEKNIIKELKIEKKIIENKDVPLKSYNYSYIKDRLDIEYNPHSGNNFSEFRLNPLPTKRLDDIQGVQSYFCSLRIIINNNYFMLDKQVF